MTDTNSGLDAGNDFLNSIFEYLKFEVEITGRETDEHLIYEFTGSTAGLKTRPDLVSALSLLTSQAVSRAVGDRRINCLIDIDGELEKRRSFLETAALDAARAVVTNGRKAVFEGLNSSERRVVHTRLKEDESVKTYSEGDDRNRLLIVEAV
jgi:spoIIIJ-associated protein